MSGKEEDFIVFLYDRPKRGSAHGRVRVNKRLVALEISCAPRSPFLRLSVCLVVDVAETRERIQPLLERASAAFKHSRARLDTEDRCILAEAQIPCAECPRNVLAQAKRADFSEFASLLSDENLLQALQLSKGRIRGTPTDLFDGDE